MIYTITLNPSIDYVVELDEFKAGEINRATQTRYYPGGKGINVSRVVKRLGGDTVALGFAAGFTGSFIKEKLIEEQVAVHLLEVEGTSRINVKLKAETETEINGTGPMIEENDVHRLLKQLNNITPEDIVVLAGSIPSNMMPEIYKLLIQKCQEHGAKAVVDTGGAALRELLPYKPFFVKPNHLELGELFDVSIQTQEEVVYYAQQLHEQGIENVVVTMAGAGAVLYSNKGVFIATAPIGEVRNSVGAGDSFVAGFLTEYVKSSNAQKALAYGVASGSATAFSYDLCKREEVTRLIDKVGIEKYSSREGKE